MFEYFYSAANNSFYPELLQERYVLMNAWPVDAIPVDGDVYQEYAKNAAPKGKQRAAGKNGLPVWVDIPTVLDNQANSR